MSEPSSVSVTAAERTQAALIQNLMQLNTHAHQFWHKTLRRSAKSSNVQELDLHNEHWNGPVLRFEWSA